MNPLRFIILATMICIAAVMGVIALATIYSGIIKL